MEQKGEAGQSAVIRAEELVDQMGMRVSLLFALTVQRIQMAVTSLREGASRLPKVAQEAEVPRPPVEKAEELVDRSGQRLSDFATLAVLQTRRVAALAREGFEDMWVDAQNIRQQSHRQPS